MDLQHRTSARVLFDEAHSEAWTIRPEIAREIQPAHPADSSYAAAADTLRARDFAVDAHTSGALTAEALAGADVLVIAHPSDAKWERTVPGGSPRFSVAELDAIVDFVHAGGGLIVLGEEEQEKYGSNVNTLIARFGIAINNDAVQDYTHHRKAPSWILADLQHGPRDGVDLLARVDAAVFYRAGTLALSNGARTLAQTSAQASTPHAPLLASTTHGAGRVVVAADSDLFGDDCLDTLGHRDLWTNLVYWAAGHAFASAEEAAGSGVEADPAWIALKQAVDALRLTQNPDGSLAEDADRAAAQAQVEAMIANIGALAARFGHQSDYLELVVADLRRWTAGGFGTPDFGASLDAFRPDLARQDGVEHLVVFPMYKQNGSRDKVFEALIVHVPWPEWLAELERTRYDNAKFVPVTLVDHTAGYDSECAVLFPETVATAGPAPNHFGGIFCDREAERFRRVVGAAAQTLRLNLPPDAAALLSSEPLSRDAYELWDLVHDRAHSHGDLPFDPFMIKQRMPYWMYSLEELRCDLTAFGESVRLDREDGFAFARHAQYAILFDRLFRFPITGPRVRNYDGLGGQLLFAYLHKTGRLHWTDNQLTIEWERVADGVMELRERVEDLYRRGIDRTKLQHWAAAHDLVAEFVSPATASKWAREVRTFSDVDDPRPYIDEVLPDEFPLSIFYSSLQRKLADVVERTPVAA
jgi:hypothetical protein